MRVPRELHMPAGAYAPARRRWGPVARPIGRLPMQLYRQRIVQVPLVGGQGQTTISQVTGSGSMTSGTAFQVFLTVPMQLAGVVQVKWSVSLAGTLAGTDANNMALDYGGPPDTLIANATYPAAAGTYTQATVNATLPAGFTTLKIRALGNTPTSGSVYSATISASYQTGIISVGPQGIGNVWYPASCTILTTSGTKDFSTCSIYLGPAGVPITQVATIFPGGFGTASLAIPSMVPGQYIIAQWTGANPGDTASINVVGTMDSVMPG